MWHKHMEQLMFLAVASGLKDPVRAPVPPPVPLTERIKDGKFCLLPMWSDRSPFCPRCLCERLALPRNWGLLVYLLSSPGMPPFHRLPEAQGQDRRKGREKHYVPSRL